MKKIIPHSRPTIGAAEIAAVSRVLKSGYVSMGHEVASFEKEAAARFSFKGVAAVSSGTAALHLALLGLRVGSGDEVIVPAYVCPALLNAVYYVGATPVLADVCFADGNIDPQDVAKRITPRTRAIIVAHMFGYPANVKELLKLGVPLVEDCAQAIGARIGDKFVGSFGHCGVFSFYATKMMTSGEGGMLTANKALLTEARDLLSYDHKPDYRLRYNYKMTDIQASLARAQLKQLYAMIACRSKIASEYTSAFKDRDVCLPEVVKGVTPAFYRYVVKVRNSAEVITKMKNAGISAERPLFRPLHEYLGLSDCPVADRLQKESVSLPIYPLLTAADRVKIKKSISCIFKTIK